MIQGAAIEGMTLDCRVADGVVAELADRLSPRPGERVVDAREALLLPGLVDHHVHLFAAAAAADSVDVGGPEGVAILASVAGAGWVRAIGAHVELTRDDLDLVVRDRPVRVQHRSGALWTLNSAALDLIAGGAHEGEHEPLTRVERRTGQLWRGDERVRSLLPPDETPDLDALGSRMARSGVTTVVDASPQLSGDGLDLLRQRLPQRVESLGPAGGQTPMKLVVADHELPSYDELTHRIESARGSGRAVAVHCVTRPALVLTLAALADVGSEPGDRIEHAAVCDAELAVRIASLDLTVVTQPSLVARHGARYWAESEPDDRDHLWPYATLLAAGVRVLCSSDAPYGDLDPWATVHAAASRLTESGAVLNPRERVAPEVALASMCEEPVLVGRPRRRIEVGATADLCLVEGSVSALALDPAAVTVRLTLIGGTVAYGDED